MVPSRQYPAQDQGLCLLSATWPTEAVEDNHTEKQKLNLSQMKGRKIVTDYLNE